MTKKVAIFLFCSIGLTATTFATNRVLVLDGNGDFMSVANDNDFEINNKTNFSVCLWFKANSSVSGNRIIYNENNYYMDLQFPSPNAAFRLNFSNGTLGDFSSHTNLTTNTWYHIALIYNGTNRKTYVNGILNTTVSNANEVSDTLEANFYIGATVSFSGLTNNQWVGSLDEISFWHKTLSDSEIKDCLQGNLTGSEQSLAAYWSFDNNTPTDDSTNTHDGILSGNASIEVDNFLNSTFSTSSIAPLSALTVSTLTNLIYRLEYTTNMLSTNWLSTGSLLRGNGQTMQFFDSTGFSTAKFYRVVLE